MKIEQLLDLIQDNGLSMPESGTGKNGRILAKDLESTLGDYFAKLKYSDPATLKHLELRRWYEPPKAYRFKDLNVDEKKEVFKDNNHWVMEQKFNGWRMVITYIPSDGFMFWGGNISDKDFLPVDYTDRVLLNGLHPKHPYFHHAVVNACILDSEAICDTDVMMLDGTYSNNTLDAIKAILGSDAPRAKELQKEHTLNFHLFDYVDDHVNYDNKKLRARTMLLDYTTTLLDVKQFHRTKQFSVNKKTTLQEFWRLGFEGGILKNLNSLVTPGSRSKHINIKVKRSMSGEIGDDLDAFVSGFIKTKEWTKKGLIGGVELSVYSHGVPHHIATVTNMPDDVRFMLTFRSYDGEMHIRDFWLNDRYNNRVLVVDGQELSARNRMILHAVVDWKRGFRKTKRAEDCVFNIASIENERF